MIAQNTVQEKKVLDQIELMGDIIHLLRYLGRSEMAALLWLLGAYLRLRGVTAERMHADDAMIRERANQRLQEYNRSASEQLFASWMGLPDDATALRLARLLRKQ